MTPARLRQLARLAALDLFGLGEATTHALWRAAVLAKYGRLDKRALIATIARLVLRSQAQARTLLDTQVSILGRQILAAEPATLIPQPYLYVGPVDGVVRPFCLAQVGQVRSQASIERLDNGQLPNPFITGGGYNCRHSWMPVSDPELAVLMNTGQRAPGFETRLSDMRAVAAQRAA